MSQNPPPIDCVPCQAKIVLDGDSVSALVEASCESVQHFFTQGGKFSQVGYDKVIGHINRMEEMAVDLQKMILKEMGYSGPLPKHLQ